MVPTLSCSLVALLLGKYAAHLKLHRKVRSDTTEEFLPVQRLEDDSPTFLFCFYGVPAFLQAAVFLQLFQDLLALLRTMNAELAMASVTLVEARGRVAPSHQRFLVSPS